MTTLATPNFVIPVASPVTPDGEICIRCGHRMIWVKASWHCPACYLKVGCCQ